MSQVRSTELVDRRWRTSIEDSNKKIRVHWKQRVKSTEVEFRSTEVEEHQPKLNKVSNKGIDGSLEAKSNAVRNLNRK